MGGSSQTDLRLDHVSKIFNQGSQSITVLSEVTISFTSGKNYALTGSSGSGKSTVINLLAGLDEPTNGTVYFNNQSIGSFDQSQKQLFLNRSIGLVFQVPHLLKELSVLENVMIKKLINSKADKQSISYAHDLLALVGLADRAQAEPLLLSGGEQQRVAIARALFLKPEFLLADEPTAHVDEKNRDIIIDLLLKSQQETGMGLIIASHDTLVSAAMDTSFRLTNNKITEIVR
jgi:lipoprotein-releasing system ATP-binding protein